MQLMHKPSQIPYFDESHCRPGVRVGRLLPEHSQTVKHYWRYAHLTPDTDRVIGDGLEVGLSAGAFVTDTTSPTAGDLGDQEEPLPADGLASWVVVNNNGGLGFLHTLSSQRRRGLAGMVLAELTRISEKAGYPPVLHTNSPSVQRMAQQLGYASICPLFWVMVAPPAVESPKSA